MAAIPSIGVWELLFERPEPPFPGDHAIFRTASTDKIYTYSDVRTKAERFGRALRSSSWNWKKGDVLMVMSPNSIDVPPVIWGCQYAGGIVVPVNPAQSAADLHYLIVKSRAKALVVHQECIEIAAEALQLAHLSSEYLLALETNSYGIRTVRQLTEEILAITEETARFTPVNPTGDLAYLVYSSGTTGRPKGVMISHRNVVSAILLQSRVEGPHVDWRKDRTLAVLPVYHIYGLICLTHLPLWLGTLTTYMEKFDLGTFCRIVQDHAITHAYVAPPIVLHLAKSQIVDGYDLRTLRMLTSGGAPLAAALIDDLYQQRQLPVRQAYGLSETTSVSHIQRRSNLENGLGSNGPPLPGLEALFVCSDGSLAKVQEEGELWVRGPTVFNGYYDEPVMTAESLTADGWFKTGDIGYEDAQGNLYVTDRLKDMIKFKGYQVAPAELEDILLSNPAVKDAAVIGVMNEDLQSEVPLGYISLNGGWTESEETAVGILEFVKNRVIHYKQLRGGIVWASQIPKSASGKILKRVLRDQARKADQGKRIGAITYGKYRATKL